VRGQRGDHAFQFVIFAEVAQRAFAGDASMRRTPEDTLPSFKILIRPISPVAPGVRAAAEFGGKISDLDDADPVAVFLAEQRHRVILVDGHVNRDIFDNLYFFVAQNFFVDDVFDVLQLFFFDAGEVREIEAQMVGRDQRPGLLDVFAEDLAQPAWRRCVAV
jgi:hypothetical protein